MLFTYDIYTFKSYFFPLKKTPLKGIVSRDEYCLKAYNNNNKVLSEHASMVFTIFCFLVDEKIKQTQRFGLHL
jgi:hypothetical protein